MKKKAIIIILISFLFGTLFFFFIPTFPIKLFNTSGTLFSWVWFSGLKFLNNGFGIGNVLIHSISGGLLSMGILFITYNKRLLKEMIHEPSR